MLIDLFVHVNESPGGYSIADVAKTASERGLDGVVLVGRGHPVLLPENQPSPAVKTFVGVELHTDLGVVLLIPSEVRGPYADRAWGDPGADEIYRLEHVLAIAAEHRWAVVAVQPFDQHFPHSSGEQLISAEGIHAVIATTGGTPLLAHDLALEAAMARDIPIVAGSNTRQSFNRLGSVATVLLREISTQRELASALTGGDVWTATMGGRTQLSVPKGPASQHNDRKRNRRPDRGRRN